MPVSTEAFGCQHLVTPLRDRSCRAVMLLDIFINSEVTTLPPSDNEQLIRLLRTLDLACLEILTESDDGDRVVHLGADYSDNDTRLTILFDRYLLIQVRENMLRFDETAYDSWLQYGNSPLQVHDIVKAILVLFEPEFAETAGIHIWKNCLPYLVPSLTEKLIQFDPTIVRLPRELLSVLHSYMDGWSRDAILELHDQLALCLYEWVIVCLSIMDRLRNTPSSIIINMQNVQTSEFSLLTS
jgi:hypothetical protein